MLPGLYEVKSNLRRLQIYVFKKLIKPLGLVAHQRSGSEFDFLCFLLLILQFLLTLAQDDWTLWQAAKRQRFGRTAINEAYHPIFKFVYELHLEAFHVCLFIYAFLKLETLLDDFIVILLKCYNRFFAVVERKFNELQLRLAIEKIVIFPESGSDLLRFLSLDLFLQHCVILLDCQLELFVAVVFLLFLNCFVFAAFACELVQPALCFHNLDRQADRELFVLIRVCQF